MAMVTAASITNLHERIKLILGTGAGQSGYGQLVNSTSVSNQSGTVNSTDLNNIYTDMISARIHQVGPGNAGISQVIQDLNVIAQTTSYFVDNLGNVTADPDGVLKGIDSVSRLVSFIAAGKFGIHPSQAVIASGIVDSLSDNWNGLRFQEVSVTFDDEDHRRHYFNTGSMFRISATNSAASTPKGLDWAALCAEIGIVSFGYGSTVSSGDGSGTQLGNYQLTTSYQTVYQKIGGGTYSGIYAGNIYTIKARFDGLNPNVILFRIEFNDIVFDNLVDNNVDGRLDSVIQQFRADGAAVSVTAPSFNNESVLRIV